MRLIEFATHAFAFIGGFYIAWIWSGGQRK